MAFRTEDDHDRIVRSSVGSTSTHSVVMPGLDPGIHPSSKESCEVDGLRGAQTSLRSLRKADYYARRVEVTARTSN
jgi:hypothetical protein